MKKEIIVDIISCLFIILFLYTGIYKLMDLTHFRWALSKSPLMEHTYLIVSDIIPPLEIIIALLLLIPFFLDTPRLRKWGLYCSAALMIIFTIYIGYMLEFRTDRPCTCGGIISQMNWHQHLYFNTSFSILALFAVWLNRLRLNKTQNRLVIS
ncbi:MauE/DoxX family redox-associated membrane protein [Flavitalea flava]